MQSFVVSSCRRWYSGREGNNGHFPDSYLKDTALEEQESPFIREGNTWQLPRRVHILGMGNVGTFIAHSLAGIPNPPPLTLLLKGYNHTRKWRKAKCSLKLTTHGLTEIRTGFDVEAELHNPQNVEDHTSDESLTSVQVSNSLEGQLGGFISKGSDNSVIYNMIVTTKAPATALSLQEYAHRLTPESTILFLQNGMGVIDEVNKTVFPEPENRPQYMIGVNSHGLKQRAADHFDVVHAGEGTIALGIMPQLLISETEPIQTLADAPPSSRYLLRTMTRTPVFVAVGFTPTALLQQQLEKLAVNAIINPLTAILDTKNGGIVANFYLKRVMRMLLAEISLIFRSLPELQNVPNVNTRFDAFRLESIVQSVAELTHSNDSSMLQDMRAARQTEIDYINGYIIRRGEELGFHCAMNYMLMHMIKGKASILDLDKRNMLPFPNIFSKFEARDDP